MWLYIYRRAASGLVGLFVFVSILFFIIQIVVPGDFVTQFAIGLSPQEREGLRRELGLHLPLWRQYLAWLGGLVSGDLGASFMHPRPPVLEVLKVVVPPTLFIFLTGTLIAFAIGIWLGAVTGWRRRGAVTEAASFGAIALYTAFPPWLAFLLIYVLALQLKLLPPLASRDILYTNRELWQASAYQPEQVMLLQVATLAAIPPLYTTLRFALRAKWRALSLGAKAAIAVAGWIGAWFVLGFGPEGLDILRFASLPILTYTLLTFGETTIIMQASMREVKHEEYIRTARAKGLAESQVRQVHAARNALMPVLSRLFISLPYLLTGLVIVELSVKWPGLGTVMFASIENQDMPTVMGALLLVGVLSLAARLALDVLHAAINPRVRYVAHGLSPS